MTQRGDRVASGLLLLVFGVWPWLILAAVWATVKFVAPRSSSLRELLPALGAVVCCAGIAVLVAFVLGGIGWLRHRAVPPVAPGSAPLRPTAGMRPVTTVARIAALLAVMGLWGPFAALLMSPLIASGGPPVDRIASVGLVVLTATAAVFGVANLVGGRPPRSS